MNAEEVRAFCRSFPGVKEDVKWEDHLCFMIGEKMFTIVALESKSSMSFKVDEEDFYQLTETDDFVPAPYLARYKWVYTEDFTQIPSNDLKQLLQKAYDIIKAKLPKKKLREIESQLMDQDDRS